MMLTVSVGTGGGGGGGGGGWWGGGGGGGGGGGDKLSQYRHSLQRMMTKNNVNLCIAETSEFPDTIQ